MHIRNFRNKLFMSAAVLLASLTAGCSMVTDDPVKCPAQLRVRFVYDYNIKFADALTRRAISYGAMRLRAMLSAAGISILKRP